MCGSVQQHRAAEQEQGLVRLLPCMWDETLELHSPETLLVYNLCGAAISPRNFVAL